MASDCLEIADSPLADGTTPVRIGYVEQGSGRPLVLLHGGWGFAAYPFDRQVAALASRRRVLLVDRSGYGRSVEITDLAADFHRRAAVETASVLDAFSFEKVVLWGHSDGAVIAVMLALAMPERIEALVLEATHLYGGKPNSRAFFHTAASDPARIVGRLAPVLEREHGARWQHVVARHGRAWLRIAENSCWSFDLYDARLRDLKVPTLLVHGARDPRTEPGELDAIRASLPNARFLVLPEGGHSPHSEPATADAVTREAASFIRLFDDPSVQPAESGADTGR